MKIIQKIFNEVVWLPEFERDFKRLCKRFRTLEDDLSNFIKSQLNLYHKQSIDNKGIFPLSGLSIRCPRIYKATKFACRSLKGRGAKSGIRIIYAYYEELDKIELIEIYFKAEKANEDRTRVKRYYLDK